MDVPFIIHNSSLKNQLTNFLIPSIIRLSLEVSAWKLSIRTKAGIFVKIPEFWRYFSTVVFAPDQEFLAIVMPKRLV